MCVDNTSFTHCVGGPIKGKVYKVHSYNYDYIGIKLIDLDPSQYSFDCINGDTPNWGRSCFKLVDLTIFQELGD